MKQRLLTIFALLMMMCVVLIPSSMAQDDDDEDMPSLVCMKFDAENESVNIVLVSPDGEDEDILDIDLGVSPTWSPDHTQIALTHFTPSVPNVHIFDVPTNRLMRVTIDDAYEYNPAWSPDGDKIVFEREYRGDRAGESGLYMVDVETFHVAPLLIDGNRHSRPKWSPNGETISFITYSPKNPTPYLIDVGSREVEMLDIDLASMIYVDWSPDGEFLVIGGTDSGPPQLYTYEWETDEIVQITESETINKYSVRWAADGDHILYTNQYDEGEGIVNEMVILSLEDGSETSLPYYNCDW